MELRRWVQVLCILPALQDFLDFRVHSMKCSDNHYFTKDGGKERCCLKCPAGERVEKHCEAGQNNTTKCKPCTNGTNYQDIPNGFVYCQPCAKQIKRNRVLLKSCTRFHNRKYGNCKKGFYHNLALDVCQPCIKCKAGYGVKNECANDTNTECEEEKCGVGTYSDQESLTQKCQPCTPCKNDEETYMQCTPSSNYGCKPKTLTTATTEDFKTTRVISTEALKTLPSGRPPTHTGREESRSWVMPFFIAAMALLLVLFMAFVIGVTIWCHIQSRNRQQNIIVQAEDPQFVQRLTKLIDDAETPCLPNEEIRYHERPYIKPGKVRENGMMIRDVSHDIIEELANFLNPTNPPSNWRKVASLLNFPWNVISNLALCPTNATQQLLERWGTKRDSTVYKLYIILKEIGRDDAAEVLERLLVRPVPSCPKSV